MRKGFPVSATIEALQVINPRTLCDELAVKGDDCRSWRVSLVVKFNIWLSKTRRVLILKLPISIRNRATKKKHENHDRKTAHGTTADFVFLPVEHPPFDLLLFTTRKFNCESRPYKKSAAYEYYWRWTRTRGITTYIRFSTTTGRERTVPRRAPAHTPLIEICGQYSFRLTTRYILFAHRRSDVRCLGFVLAPLHH